MTEAEWMTCADPGKMLNFLRNRVSDRKLQLFAVACCHRFRHLLDEGSRAALDVAVRGADGRASAAELGVAEEEAINAHCDSLAEYHNNPQGGDGGRISAARAVVSLFCVCGEGDANSDWDEMIACL